MKKIFTLMTLLVSSITIAFSQDVIKGVVRDDAGEPVPGATVVVKGTSIFGVTNANGEFSLNSPTQYPFSVQVNLVGFKQEEIEFYESPGDDAIDISLKLDQVLNEVVVVGYGIQKKGDVTGAVASVSDKLLAQPVSSLDRGLQGAVAGVQVTTTSGQPGGGASIRIRGGSSITGGNEPLYVIDGFPITTTTTAAGTITGSEVNPLSSLNPADIASIDILKDASATAIYGSRGANGVVIITTKKGQNGKSTITYDGSVGVQSLRKKISLLNARQFAALRNDALFDTNPALGQFQYLSQEEIDNLGEGTDWQDEAFRDALTTNHQVSINGGTDKIRYYVSGGYFDQDGIIRNTDFQRFSGRVNLDIQATEKLNIGTNLSVTRSSANVAPNGIVTALLSMPPTATIYNENGGYTLRNPFENIFSNPIASLKEQTNATSTRRLLGTVYGEYQLLEGLQLKVSFGTDIASTRENRYVPSNIYEGSLVGGEAGTGFLDNTSWLNENTLTYTRSFGKHSVTALAGFTQQEEKREIVRTGAQKFVSDHFEYNNLENGGTVLRPYSRLRTAGLLSYLARVNYNYADRYLFTASVRADGSSRFGDNNKWGYFPSVAASWKIKNEQFFESAPDAISDLKVRASFGATGNNGIEPYSSLTTLNSVTYLVGGSIVNGFTPSRIGNPKLGWETSYQVDAGIDIGLFDNRVSVNVDVYRKKTVDLLLDVELPYTSGYSTSLQNYGSVVNRGLEIGINTINLDGDIKWSTGVNFSLNRNEVVSLGGGLKSFITGNYIVKVGQPLGTYYATITDGILQADEVATKGAFTGNATPKAGDRLYKDISGDGKFTTALDRDIVGNAQPDFIFGITNTISWKGFDVFFLLQGTQGNKILNGNRQVLELFNGQQNAASSALNRYRTDNPSTSMPRAKLDPAPVFSDRFIEDGSFVRLKTITFGYTLPQSLAEQARLSSVRFYVTANNLLTWTKYTGFDPEITSGNNTTQQGTDTGVYPISKTISGGVTLSF